MRTRNVISPEGVKLLNALKSLENKSVKVGWIERSEYPNGASVAGIAAQNEFGNPQKNIPARPFMRPTIQERQNAWTKTVADGARKVLKNELSIENVLDLLGSNAVGDIKKTIKKLFYPALAEKTILARIERNKRLSSKKGQLSEKNLGNITKPLVDTGTMLNTITHEVSD